MSYRLRQILKSAYRTVLMWLPRSTRVRLIHRRMTGSWLNLSKPRTLGEIIQWRKVNLTPGRPLGKRIVETGSKLSVREYLTRHGFGEYLSSIVAVAHSPSEVQQLDLTKPSILKAAHGSSMNAFVRESPSDEEALQLRNDMVRWLESEFGAFNGEWWYNLGPRAIIQENLHQSDGNLPGYGFYCFRGTVAMLYVESDPQATHAITYFKPDWTYIDVSVATPQFGWVANDPNTAPPELLEDMLRLCEKLSRPFDFVRIDLYEVSGPRIVIGEMTHSPTAGLARFSDPAVAEWLAEEYYRHNPNWPDIERDLPAPESGPER